jgi:hypothetical protein
VGFLSSISRMRRPVTAILFLAIASTASAAQASDWQSRMTPRVQNALNAANTAQSVESIAAVRQAGGSARYDSNGRLQIDVEFDCAQPAPTAALITAGMVVGTTVKAPPMCVVEGWAPVNAIPSLALLPSVKKIDLPHYSIPHPPMLAPSEAGTHRAANALATNGSPAIDGNGIAIMNVTNYIQQTTVNGTGVTIGVISDDVTSLAMIQARGELPTVNVVAPSATPTPHPKPTDEGTMMLEEVYASAPGAQLAFCGPNTGVEYIGCLQNLIAAGVTVVSDDLGFTAYDVMSAPAQNASGMAVENVLTTNPNVMLFHAVGNQAPTYWQGTYLPVPQSPSACHGQTDNFIQQFSAPADYTIWQTTGGNSIYLASALPAGQTSPNNFDVYVYDPVNAIIVTCSSATSNGGTIGATSYTIIDGSTITSGTYWIFIATADTSLSSTFLKLIGTDDASGTSFSPMTSGAPASPQDFAAGVITVGAVYGNDGVGTTAEPFSDTGPIQVELPTPSTVMAPLLAAPDAIYVDNSGTKFPASGGIFYGTSAASPNAASVAALLRSAFPTLTPAQITSYMESGATQLGTSPWNGTFGYGRVDALGALAQIPAPTISGLQATTILGGSSSPPLPFAVGGTDALKVAALSSVFWMTPVISPSNCGTGAYNCTLTLTPAIGSFAPSTVQVSVTDGANRVQSMQIPVTVTKPAPPAVSITSGTMQSVPVNSAIAPINFTVAGTGPLTVYASNNGVPGVNVTSGCGTTVMTCTANLGTAGTATGVVTLVIGAQDSYGQVSSSLTTVTITNPPPPTIMITSGATQSVMVNAAIAPVAFTLTGTGNLTVTPTSTGISSLTISSGCGTTTMSCTASLGMAQSTAGTATLTLTVEDSYVQSASASATVTENAPPGKSGGGALDPWALLGLTGLVLVQMNRAARKRK